MADQPLSEEEASLRSAMQLIDPTMAQRHAAAMDPYFDTQMAQEIVKRLGGFDYAYRPQAKHFVGVGSDKLHQPLGFHQPVNPEYELEPWQYRYKTPDGRMYADVFMPQRDDVYNLGAQPSATVLSHEYRHRAGIMDEYRNRLYDAMYAQNDDDWHQAVRMWGAFKGAEDTPEDLAIAEEDLLREIEKMREPLLRTQYDMAPEGQKPLLSEEPSIGGFLADVFRSPRDNYAARTTLPYQRLGKTTK